MKNKYNCVVYTYNLLILGFDRKYSDYVVLDEIQNFASEEEALDFYLTNYTFPESTKVSFNIIMKKHSYKIECEEVVESLN